MAFCRLKHWDQSVAGGGLALLSARLTQLCPGPCSNFASKYNQQQEEKQEKQEEQVNEEQEEQEEDTSKVSCSLPI